MAQGSQSLSRRQLERVLGLPPGSSNTTIMAASLRLLTRLEERREREEGVDQAALAEEIERLSTSVLTSFGSSVEPVEPITAAGIAALSSSLARERLFMGAIVILATLVIVFFAAWLNLDANSEAGLEAVEPARLIVESRPSEATLRIRAPESEELFVKISADAAALELDPGHYEVEVSREDCPDSWTREIVLEEAETRRYEPTICVGAGELVVRSNVSGDRLRIDGLDLGATRAEAHLLGVGNHVVRVEKQGFEPFEGQVRILPDERIELRAELIAAAGNSGGGGGAQGGNGSAGGKGGPQAAPLPFDVVTPSRPPGSAIPNPGQVPATDRRALLPEPIAPDAVRPEDLAMPDPIRDFDYEGNTRQHAKGGSTTWHDAVSKRIVDRYDADGSGRIDRDSETEAIPCELWAEIEQSFDEGRLGLSMSRLYGFDGSEWHPNALGIARTQRGVAYQRMQTCGLAP